MPNRCVFCGEGNNEVCDQCLKDIDDALNTDVPLKTAYENYMACIEWKFLRRRAYERAGNMCELCGELAFAVHHIKYPRHYTEDNLKNLIVVCESCHNKLHGLREG